MRRSNSRCRSVCGPLGRWALPSLCALALIALIAPSPVLATASTSTEGALFNIFVEDDGVYVVSYEDLEAFGWKAEHSDPEQFTLTSLGQDVPFWVVPSDRPFGPGSRIEFIGRHLQGESSYYRQGSRRNVLHLAYGIENPGASRGAATFEIATPEREAVETDPRNRFRRRMHLEEENVLLRFGGRGSEAQDLWYWQKLTQIDRKRLSVEVLLNWSEIRASQPAKLKVGVRGWSQRNGQRHGLPDHRIEFTWNGDPIGELEWDGQEARVFEVDLPLDVLRNRNRVTLRVPKRFPEGQEDPIIDVSALDWIEIEYPRRAMFSTDHHEILHVDGAERQSLQLSHRNGGELTAYLPERALRLQSAEMRSEQINEQTEAVRYLSETDLAPGEEVFVVADQNLMRPVGLVRDHESQLRSSDQQSDYLMIVHPRLRAPMQPLADFHRERGLEVSVIDPQDIYDEFAYGIESIEAIRDFVQHAYTSWQEPRPRFVLLVGDASWDTRNEEVEDRNYADWTYRPNESRAFAKNESIPYADDPHLNNRNLIPAGSFKSSQGHAASDNYFVAIDGDDFFPDLAIGRFPVTTPEEVDAIVEKTISHASAPVGPWRRNILWITDDRKASQNRTERLIATSRERGYVGERIYPHREELNNEEHNQSIRTALDSGQYVVHFYGHGGRYIWRTGPPDYKKNHDLFTIDDVDQLEENDRLPIILSMTCYSAPYDHPNADSIGEKLLRAENRGGVAVFAASWRNSPTEGMSKSILDQFDSFDTLGEAVVAAKQASRSRQFVEMYNLLGDPALPLLKPQLDVTVQQSEDGEKLVASVGGEEFSGKGLVEFKNEEGDVIETRRGVVASGQLEEALPTNASGALVYVWNDENNVDGVATLSFADAASAPAGGGE